MKTSVPCCVDQIVIKQLLTLVANKASVSIELNSDRLLFASIDVSENPYIKSFKPGPKLTNYEINHDIKHFIRCKSKLRQMYKTV